MVLRVIYAHIEWRCRKHTVTLNEAIRVVGYNLFRKRRSTKKYRIYEDEDALPLGYTYDTWIPREKYEKLVSITIQKYRGKRSNLSTARSVVIAVRFSPSANSRQATLPGAVPCKAALGPTLQHVLTPSWYAPRDDPDPGAASPKRYCRGRYSLVRRFLAFYTIRDENFGQKHTSNSLNLQKVHN